MISLIPGRHALGADASDRDALHGPGVVPGDAPGSPPVQPGHAEAVC